MHGFTPGDTLREKDGLQMMRTLGRNMAWLLKCIACGRVNTIDKQVPKPRMRTQFIRDKY